MYVGPANQLRYQMGNITQQLETAEAHQSKELNAQLEEANEKLAALETIRYNVDEPILQNYQALLEHAVINTQDIAWEELTALKYQMFQREIDAETCISSVLSIIHMRMMEE